MTSFKQSATKVLIHMGHRTMMGDAKNGWDDVVEEALEQLEALHSKELSELQSTILDNLLMEASKLDSDYIENGIRKFVHKYRNNPHV